MVDPTRTVRWSYRGLFLLLSAFFVFLRILPLSTVPSSWPGPDLMLCLTFAWVLRRPDFVPALMIAAVFLIEDILYMRPPGLMALLILLGSEFLRSREPGMRGLPFPAEWAVVAVVMVTIMLVYRAVLAILVVPQGAFGFALLQVLTTILAYPVVVWVSHHLFGLRRAATGEVDALGHRL
ncbi:MAG: rod shape-determining protein MreD [Pseudomonadota bacterium]